jgi:hypothetical protein
MKRKSVTFGVIAAAALAPTVWSCAQTRAITDEWVLDYATKPYERRFPMGREVLGTLNDVAVVADFVCSDVCPAYTVRIVHFDVEPGARCTAIGGVERSVTVPIAITATQKVFCFPSVLAQNWGAIVR